LGRVAAARGHESDVTVQQERHHELSNIIAGASAVIDVLEEDVIHPDRDRLMRVLGDELRRMTRLLAGDAGADCAPTTYDVAEISRDVVLMYALGVPVRVEMPGTLTVAGDPDAFRHALVNVLLNCARYAPGSSLVVRADSDTDVTRVRVEDDGAVAGLDGAGRGGAGIGLAISRRLLAQDGATIDVAPRDDVAGWAAVIGLPTAAAA
jgi:signal transduction histidine kinase